MQQLIYASRPLVLDQQGLCEIASSSRERNARYDITGALIYRDDIILQLLEGPVAAVERLFDNISKDARHEDVRVLVRAKVEDRLFPDWAMKYDPASSWLWDRSEIARGALDRAHVRDIRAVFVRSAD